MRFQIYEETGLTPAPATRTAAVIDHGFVPNTVDEMVDDKENQFPAVRAVAAAATVKKLLPTGEEPMAVDFVSMGFVHRVLV